MKKLMKRIEIVQDTIEAFYDPYACECSSCTCNGTCNILIGEDWQGIRDLENSNNYQDKQFSLK